MLHLLPAAKDVLDREQTHIGEIFRVLCRNLLVDWAVEVIRDDLLRLRPVEILQIGLGEFARAALIHHLVDHCDGEIGAQADRGNHEIRLVLAVLASDALDFGLEGHKHVANAMLDESSGRRTAASVNTGILANSLRTNAFAFS